MNEGNDYNMKLQLNELKYGSEEVTVQLLFILWLISFTPIWTIVIRMKYSKGTI